MDFLDAEQTLPALLPTRQSFVALGVALFAAEIATVNGEHQLAFWKTCNRLSTKPQLKFLRHLLRTNGSQHLKTKSSHHCISAR